MPSGTVPVRSLLSTKSNWFEYLYVQVILISTLDGSLWSNSCHGLLTLGDKAPGTHWIGAWEGFRFGVEAVEGSLLPLLEIEPQLLGHPACLSGSFLLIFFILPSLHPAVLVNFSPSAVLFCFISVFILFSL